MITELVKIAPQESIFIVESDVRFDQSQLPDHAKWAIRKYSPALVAVLKKQAASDEQDDVQSE